jgi:hypothetical protein
MMALAGALAANQLEAAMTRTGISTSTLRSDPVGSQKGRSVSRGWESDRSRTRDWR